MLCKRIFRHLFLLFILFVFISCDNTNKNSMYIDGDGYMHISFFHGGSSRYSPGNILEKYIQEKTKVKLDYEINVGDLSTKTSLMIASGDFPDLINARDQIPMFIQAGAFIPLEDLILEHAPRIKELYSPYWERLKSSDGHIYTLPEVLPYGPPLRTTSGKAFWIQRIIIEEAGYPRLNSLEEYFDLLQSYKDKNPMINGQETIAFEPLTVANRLWYFEAIPMALAGYPTETIGIVDCVENRWIMPYDFIVSDMSYKTFKIFNDAYKRGLLTREAFTTTEDRYQEKLASGRVLGTFSEAWIISNSMNILKNEHPDREFVGFPLIFDDTSYDDYNIVDTPNYGQGVGISIDASDPIAIIKFIDKTLYEDVQKLAAWGIEGEDYLVGSDGRYYKNDEQRARFNDSVSFEARVRGGISPYIPIQIYGSYSDGNSASGSNPTDYFAGLSEAHKNFLRAYEIEADAQLFTTPSAFRNEYGPLYTIQLDSNILEEKRLIEVEQDRNNAFNVAELVLADNYDSAWNRFLDNYNAVEDIAYYIQGYQKKIDERVEAWTKDGASCVEFKRWQDDQKLYLR